MSMTTHPPPIPETLSALHPGRRHRHQAIAQLRRLAATLQVLLQSRRLRVAPTLPESAMLARELAAFQMKVSTSAVQEMDAWRQGAHDDLVLAVAVAAWLGEHAMRRLVVWV